MPQITVSGDVNLLGWEGKKVSVWEKYDVLGKTYSRLWTCWFDFSQADQIQEQDWVTIQGELSTKIGTYTPKGATEEKTVVEHHVQNARITGVVSKEQQNANQGVKEPNSLEDAPF